MLARSLVVPMHDEARRIGRTLERVAHEVDVTSLELVLVDDGSTDGTVEAARAALVAHGLEHGRVLEAPHRGKGHAVRAGLLEASGVVRVFVDADLPVAGADLERCFRALEDGAAVAYGSRTHPDSEVLRPMPPWRRASSAAFAVTVRTAGLAQPHERDTQCGLKGVRAEAVPTVVTPLITDGFAFDVELLARARRAGLSVERLPVRWSHVDATRGLAVRNGLKAFGEVVRIRRSLRRAG